LLTNNSNKFESLRLSIIFHSDQRLIFNKNIIFFTTYCVNQNNINIYR